MWQNFLETYNCKTIIREPSSAHSTTLHMYSDASKIGYGAVYGTSWIQGRWQTFDITVLELYPIFLLISMFGFKLKNSKITFHCDNIAVVAVINKQTSKSPQLMHIIRKLVITLLTHNICLHAVHIEGSKNFFCDSVSRYQVTPAILQQFGMKPTPMPIPAHLLPENFKPF